MPVRSALQLQVTPCTHCEIPSCRRSCAFGWATAAAAANCPPCRALTASSASRRQQRRRRRRRRHGQLRDAAGPWLGLQADGAVGTFDDELLGWWGPAPFHPRPIELPARPLRQLSHVGSDDIWRAALEGELYLGRVTLEGLGGYESLDAPELVDGLRAHDRRQSFLRPGGCGLLHHRRFQGECRLSLHQRGELRRGRAEYLIRGFEVPLSLFARGDFGDEDFNVTGGLRSTSATTRKGR